MHMSTEQCQSQTDAKGVRLSGLACVECPMSQEEKRREGRELDMLVGRSGSVEVASPMTKIIDLSSIVVGGVSCRVESLLM